MPTGGKFRCTWFARGRRCPLLPTKEHRDHDGKLWAFLCIAHEYHLQKVMRSGTQEEIRAALDKAQGRKK